MIWYNRSRLHILEVESTSFLRRYELRKKRIKNDFSGSRFKRLSRWWLTCVSYSVLYLHSTILSSEKAKQIFVNRGGRGRERRGERRTGEGTGGKDCPHYTFIQRKTSPSFANIQLFKYNDTQVFKYILHIHSVYLP